MSKLTREEAAELLHEASRYLDVAEHTIRELPPTPGRSEAEQGIAQTRRGIAGLSGDGGP